MRILVLGGTMFLGPHLVDAAIERGHEVTLFNRGRHNAELFPDLEKLRGDRDGGLDALDGRTWDAAVDTCGYVPRLVRDASERLAGAVGHYTFVSSISVYADEARTGQDETAAVGTLEDEAVEEITGETYGPLKALCEAAAEAAIPDRVLNVRPGLIVGPLDPTDRFTYWPVRVARGGEVLAPGRPEQVSQIIDARDLAAWLVCAIEAGKTGTFNATGPAEPPAMGRILETCRTVTGSDASFVWLDETFLLENDVAPFSELPLWVPDAYAGLLDVDIAKALAAGLTFRPLADTVRDTLAWHAARPAGTDLRSGLAPEREATLLAAWRARA